MRVQLRTVSVVGALALSLMVGACGRDLPPSALVGASSIPAADREPMPSISGPTLDGASLDLASLRGKIVVLNSWASWCGPCTDEAPQIAEFRHNSDPAKVAVVGLDVTDKSGDAKDFVAKYGITYPSIVDPEGALLATIPGVPPAALPSTVIIDADGRIAGRVIGATTAQQLRDLVASASE
jgi:hypothetical protein